jgi:Uma2 family endonuclease
MTVAEYIAADEASERRLEYHDGEVCPLAWANFPHAMIQANMAYGLSLRLRGKPCQIIGTMRVRVSPVQYLQPDLIVYCGEAALTPEPDASLTNPKVLFEILSPSTADYDYGSKFQLYRLLPSLEEYVLVAQDQPRVEVFRKSAGGKWILSSYQGEQSAVAVESLEIELPLTEIYANLPTTAE